jgi:8-oxo-dGTP diphosphatase
LLAFPGGHLEAFENYCECSARELLEETNLKVKRFEELIILNVIRQEKQYHCITILTTCQFDGNSTIVNTEPEKHGEWFWVDEVTFKEHYLK